MRRIVLSLVLLICETAYPTDRLSPENEIEFRTRRPMNVSVLGELEGAIKLEKVQTVWKHLSLEERLKDESLDSSSGHPSWSLMTRIERYSCEKRYLTHQNIKYVQNDLLGLSDKHDKLMITYEEKPDCKRCLSIPLDCLLKSYFPKRKCQVGRLDDIRFSNHVTKLKIILPFQSTPTGGTAQDHILLIHYLKPSQGQEKPTKFKLYNDVTPMRSERFSESSAYALLPKGYGLKISKENLENQDHGIQSDFHTAKYFYKQVKTEKYDTLCSIFGVSPYRKTFLWKDNKGTFHLIAIGPEDVGQNDAEVNSFLPNTFCTDQPVIIFEEKIYFFKDNTFYILDPTEKETYPSPIANVPNVATYQVRPFHSYQECGVFIFTNDGHKYFMSLKAPRHIMNLEDFLYPDEEIVGLETKVGTRHYPKIERMKNSL